MRNNISNGEAPKVFLVLNVTAFAWKEYKLTRSAPAMPAPNSFSRLVRCFRAPMDSTCGAVA